MQRKILLSIIGILIIICTIFLSYEKINKVKEVNDNSMFAIFLEEEKDSGIYQKSNLKTWPTEDEYTINMLKSYCENGSVLRWNSETKKLSLKVTGTDKCYVYFDKAEIGSEKHPHLIQTIEDLVKLSNDVAGGKTYTGEYFLLTNDLDFNDPGDYEDANRTDFQDINGINGNEALIKELTTGSGFKPIGNSFTNSFQGIFDGGNKRIDNLYVDSNIGRNVGLFGKINGDVTIKNLTISGTIKRTAAGEMGGLVARVDGKIYIENCHNEVNANDKSGTNTVAGLIGSLGQDASATIKNSSNKGNMDGGVATAGLVAYSNGSLIIENSINYGNITNNLETYAGGLLGKDNSVTNTTIINNSHNEGNVTTSNIDKVTLSGGLIANVNGTVSINNSYNMGTIKFANENADLGNDIYHSIGGLIGDTKFNGLSRYITIKKSYNAGNLFNGRFMGGLIGMHQNVGRNRGTIISESYNLGNLVFNRETDKYSPVLGGLIGWSPESKIIILNSFNFGNIEANSNGSAGGIIAISDYSLQLNVINSYNIGNLSGFENLMKSGLTNILSTKNSGDIPDTHVLVNNFYNLGKITNKNNYGVSYVYDLNAIEPYNTYNYDYNVPSNYELKVINKNESEIKSEEFVNILNENIVDAKTIKKSDNEQIILEEIDELLKDYTLSKWQLGPNGYPELINE